MDNSFKHLLILPELEDLVLYPSIENIEKRRFRVEFRRTLEDKNTVDKGSEIRLKKYYTDQNSNSIECVPKLNAEFTEQDHRDRIRKIYHAFHQAFLSNTDPDQTQ